MAEVKHGQKARLSDSSRPIPVTEHNPLLPSLTYARDQSGWYPYQQSKWTPWDCDWRADISFLPSVGNGVLTARYLLRDGPAIDFKIGIALGSTTNGGRGGWTFSLPYPVADLPSFEQNGSCKGFATGGSSWVGFLYLPQGSQIVVPYLPFNSSVSFLGQVQSCDLTGAVGTGVPSIPGNFSFTTGCNLFMWGTYEPKF